MEVGDREKPGEARPDDRAVDPRRVEQGLGGSVPSQVAQGGGELLDDQHEEAGVKEEKTRTPQNERA